MPRNGAGTFGVVNPIVVGALRSSAAVNQNFTDMGDEITNSLPLNGEAGMSGAFKAIDGSALLPGISFADDTNVGFRRSATDEMKWVAGGSDRATMDANGKLTLPGGLAVSGAFTHSSGAFSPQTLSGSGGARATLRNSANDTDEHEIASYGSGSGSGAKASLRMVGGGSNDVATMRFYVNDVLTFQWTGSLFTHAVDTLFGASGIRGDADGFFDFPELSAAPSSPSANTARSYARDDGSGNTSLYYKDGSGNEAAFQPPVVSQVFTSSGTWQKPTNGQTTALIECWGGGGGGGSEGFFGFDTSGGGGGGYNTRCIALASLSSSVSVTVGSGGAGAAEFDDGETGGTSSFGTYLTAYGGGPGPNSFVTTGAGGGGGNLSAGSIGATGTSTSQAFGGAGGLTRGFLGASSWGGQTTSADGNSNPFGGGAGGAENHHGGHSLMGGGGGGGAGPFDGGASFFGGGGGGGTGGGGGSGGPSIRAGSGGNAGQAGSTPAGGGGGGDNNGGNGGNGEVRIRCW